MSSKFDSSFLESEMACSSMLDMKLKAKSWADGGAKYSQAICDFNRDTTSINYFDQK
jgi:hypothetical protein